MEKGQNHYQVLGVERTADDRAIKKAYFALVRANPPETHPEEFKRLREAYEVLRDPIARQRFDDADREYGEYDGDVAAALREAEAAAKAGDEAAVQAKLRPLVGERPDLRILRERLAASYARDKRHKEALAELDALVQAAPEEARYHFQRALVLRSLEKPKKARRAVERAHEIDPGNLVYHLALVDILARDDEHDAALAELGLALDRQKDGSPEKLRVVLRRIHILFMKGEPRSGHAEIDHLVEEIRGADDADLPRWVSSQLAAIAATFFAQSKIPIANEILARCEEVDPASAVDRPFPAEATLSVAALPEATQAWLAKIQPGPGQPTLPRSAWPKPVTALLGSVALATVVGLTILSEPTPWSPAGAVAAAAFAAAAVAALSLSVRWVLGVLQSPLRAFVAIHPLYILEAEVDRLRVRPLFCITNLRAVHHHTNGVYTHTLITLTFDSRAWAISIRGQQLAEGWIRAVMGARGRALELMMEGYLEAEHGVDLLPPAMLTRPPPGARAGGRRWYAATAAAAAAVAIAIFPLHARGVDDTLFRTAVGEGTPAAYQRYLDGAPSGRHAADARRLLARAYERGREGLLAATSPAAAPLLTGVMGALERRGATRVPLAASGAARAQAIVARLNHLIELAGAARVMTFVAQEDAGAPVTLSVRCDPGPRSLACEARLDVEGSPGAAWRTTLTAAGASGPDALHEALARWLSASLGLGALDDAARLASEPSASTSPYRR